MILVATFYFSLYGVLSLVGLLLHQENQKKHRLLSQDKNKISIEELSILIPFRNEFHRIQPLLDSLLNATILPKNIVFIDDQSNDQTDTLIQSELKGLSFQLVTNDAEGKKSALHKGISLVDTKYILTMDADVSFQPDYFETVGQLFEAEMHILPVKMESKHWNQLMEMDVYMINALNTIANGISHPIVASGANLLFEKASYLKYHSLDHHQHIASGDDQFLLRDFNHHKATIAISTYSNIAISTPSPSTVAAFLQQRLRWIAKTPKVKDPLATKIAALQLSLTLIFAWILFREIMHSNYSIALAYLLLKTCLDGVIVFSYLKKIGKTKLLLILPIYELLFPIYSLLLAGLLLFYKPKWKGRPI